MSTGPNLVELEDPELWAKYENIYVTGILVKKKDKKGNEVEKNTFPTQMWMCDEYGLNRGTLKRVIKRCKWDAKRTKYQNDVQKFKTTMMAKKQAKLEVDFDTDALELSNHMLAQLKRRAMNKTVGGEQESDEEHVHSKEFNENMRSFNVLIQSRNLLIGEATEIQKNVHEYSSALAQSLSELEKIEQSGGTSSSAVLHGVSEEGKGETDNTEGDSQRT